MVKARKYVVKSTFQGLPKQDDFEIIEYELPPLKYGEVMVKTEWISVDPYLRVQNNIYKLPYDQFSLQIGQVIESNHPDYPVGIKLVSHIGWCDYGIVQMNGEDVIRNYKLPDLENLPTSYGIGALGRPGATAYFGLLEICKPNAGETIVVTGAGGAVGNIVGQIAKIKKCRVIGFTGTDDKALWLENELGFDKAFNYKTVDVTKALQEAAPNGIDCYFDNVGGEISSMIIRQMNTFGRVACCGSISSYNNIGEMPKATMIQQYLVVKQITVEGFNVTKWWNKWDIALLELRDWITKGELKVKEQITIGFDNVFNAFIGMLFGENYGKAIVKV